MKVSYTRSHDLPAGELRLNYILTKKLSDGMYYLEVDFFGDLRPEFYGCGADNIVFGPEGDKSPWYVCIDFQIPKRWRGCSHIVGEVTKRTWRGFILSHAENSKLYVGCKTVGFTDTGEIK